MSSTDIEVRGGSDLTIGPDQRGFTPQQVAALHQIGVENATDGDLAVFFHQAQKRGLDPFTRQIYMIGRRSKDPRTGEWVTKQTIQTGIDGFRLIARRAADLRHEPLSIDDTLWADPNGKWHDVWIWPEPPQAAKTTVRIGGGSFSGVATLHDYCPINGKTGKPTGQWGKMPAVMLAKCFDRETEVLTDHGFRPFHSIGAAKILQVTPNGLESTDSHPFQQTYSGPMIGNHADMLDFSVTPNHDMITTVGRVEAGAMLATSTTRPTWRIPLTIADSSEDSTVSSDEDLRLAGAIVADGFAAGGSSFRVAVSRPAKVAALADLGPTVTGVQHCKGAEVDTGRRVIRSNFDKIVYTFDASRIQNLIDQEKVIDVATFLMLSQRQIRIFMDSWIEFDGHMDGRSKVRRLFTSRPDHLAAAETLAVAAGYTVNVARERTSDISDRPLTISSTESVPVTKPWRNRPGIAEEEAPEGQEVWCVNVPSHTIVVRRHGFSMVCGNCSEALALRKAFPEDLAGLYTGDEMDQADGHTEAQQVATQKRSTARVDWSPITEPMKTLGMDKGAVLAVASDLLGREVTTMSGLTQDEVDKIGMALVESKTVDAEVVDEQTGEVQDAFPEPAATAAGADPWAEGGAK